MTDVTDVIVARQLRREPFSAMVTWSLAAHLAAVAALLFGPFHWGASEDDTPRTVMTISLAGAPGPRAGGMTPMGGRAIPEPVPAPPKPTPAPKPRARTAPTRRARQPPPQPQPAPEQEPQPGVTRTETGARGQGFGLTTGGAGGSGVQLDVSNFCCPEYIEQMVTFIQRNWQASQGVRGSTLMKFTITRAGSIQGVVVERPSGFVALDLAAERALLVTRLPELPPQFPNPTLTVHITFEYQR
ncbi:MAG: TonB C-terminal domain-containing protein [Acidobacteria bacterium]|nr:TonB C-terminal domain-containing protein [Acidobacteriota bacterium]